MKGHEKEVIAMKMKRFAALALAGLLAVSSVPGEVYAAPSGTAPVRSGGIAAPSGGGIASADLAAAPSGSASAPDEDYVEEAYMEYDPVTGMTLMDGVPVSYGPEQLDPAASQSAADNRQGSQFAADNGQGTQSSVDQTSPARDVMIEEVPDTSEAAPVDIVEADDDGGDVTFDANGGFFWSWSGETKTKANTYTEYIYSDYPGYIYAPKNEDLHKKFMGWSTTQNGAVKYTPASDWDTYCQIAYDPSVTTYYAVWSDGYYVITYDAAGGTMDYYDNVNEESVKGASGCKLRKSKTGSDYDYASNPKSPRADQIFAGWYTKDGKKYNTWDDSITGDITVTAKYSEYYTVTADANGGFIRDWDNDTSEEMKLTNKTIKVPKGMSVGEGDGYCPTPENTDTSKIFGGWSEDKTGSNLIGEYLSGYIPKSDCTVYAFWASTFKVTFDAGAGTFATGGSKVSYDAIERKVYSENSGAAIPSDPAGSGDNAFEGWYTDAALTKRITPEQIKAAVITGDTTYYAKYLPSCTVTFDINGGKFVSSKNAGKTQVNVKVASGKSVGKYVPTVDTSDPHKVFEGWFTDQTCKNEVKNLYSYEITANTILYAGWTDCYLLTFHTNKSGLKFSDNGQETQTIRIVKGTALRYGASGSDKDVLYEAPRMNNTGAVEETGAWFIKNDGTGIKYYLTSDRHYSVENGMRTDYSKYGFIPVEDMDLYAYWDTVQITWDANGASFDTSTYYDRFGVLSADHTKRVKTVVKGTSYNELDKPYGFVNQPAGKSYNWGYFDSACKNSVKYDYVFTEDTTIYCNWVKTSSGGSSSSSNNITYHAGEGYFDGSNKSYSASYYLGSNSYNWTPEAKIDDPKRAFTGWFYDEKLTKPYPANLYHFTEEGSAYLSFESKVSDLYAGYGTAYTVTLDANGGYYDQNEDRTKDPDESMRDQYTITKKVGQGFGFRICDINERIRRDGDKIFAGWCYDPELTSPVLTFCSRSSNECFVPTSDATLYAKWIDYEKATDLKLNGAEVNIGIGESAKLLATVTPATVADTQDIHWYSQNGYRLGKNNKYGTFPARVYSDGTVVGYAEGAVWAYAEVNGVRTAIVTINVGGKSKPQSSSMSLDTESLTLKAGGTATVNATVTPETLLSTSQVAWTSKDTAIASVASSGASSATITAGDKEGTTTITAKIGKLTKTLTVTVSAPLKIDRHEIVLTAKEGVSATITPTVTAGLNASDIIWASSNPAAATVAGGVVTPAADITETVKTTITATLKDGEETYEQKCEVTINPVPTVSDVGTAPSSGAVRKGTKVQLISGTSGARIYYTMTQDGTEPSTPTPESTLYSDPITVGAAGVKIKAYAVKDGYKDSPVSEYTFSISEDWGDIGEEVKTGALADKTIANVPEGIWYVIGNGPAIEKYSGEEACVAEYYGVPVTFDGDIHVFHGTRRLYQGRDYTVTYKNNKAVGSFKDGAKAPSVTIKGKGSYKNAITLLFTIKAPEEAGTGTNSIAKAKVTNIAKNIEFTGKEIAPEDIFTGGKPSLTLNGSTLKDEDYTVSMTNYGATGKLIVTFIGQGSYTGAATATVTVKPYNMKTDSKKYIHIDASDADYCKAGSVPEDVTVTFGNDTDGYVTLKEGIDYKLSYKNNTAFNAAKLPEVLVKGIGNFTGQASAAFKINKTDASNITLVAKGKTPSTKAGAFKSVPKLMDGGKAVSVGNNKDVEPIDKNAYRYFYAEDTTLANGTERYMDEEIGAEDILPSGTTVKITVTVKCAASSPYTSDTDGTELVGYYQILDKAHDLGSAKVTFKKGCEPVFDNGEFIIPSESSDIEVKINGQTLSPEYFEIAFIKDNRFTGTAKMLINGLKPYGGSKIVNFKIGAKSF